MSAPKPLPRARLRSAAGPRNQGTSWVLLRLAAFYEVEPDIFQVSNTMLKRIGVVVSEETLSGAVHVVGQVILNHDCRGDLKRKGRLPTIYRRLAEMTVEARPPVSMSCDDFLCAVERELQSALKLSGA